MHFFFQRGKTQHCINLHGLYTCKVLNDIRGFLRRFPKFRSSAFGGNRHERGGKDTAFSGEREDGRTWGIEYPSRNRDGDERARQRIFLAVSLKFETIADVDTVLRGVALPYGDYL